MKRKYIYHWMLVALVLFCCAPSPAIAAEAAEKPLTQEEVDRVMALPFLKGKGNIRLDRVVVSGGQKRLACYSIYEGKNARVDGSDISIAGPVFHEVDLNGDEFPDMIVTGDAVGRMTPFIAYAGCGNGLYYDVGRSNGLVGTGVTLEDGVTRHGQHWKTIVLAGKAGAPLPAPYRFVMVDEKYIWEEGARLVKMPWVPKGSIVGAAYIPGDAGKGKPEAVYFCEIGSGEWTRMTSYFTKRPDGVAASIRYLDLNGDAVPDIAIDNQQDGTALYAGCGNGWYIRVFDDFRPGDSFGEPLFTLNGLSWKTILRKRVDVHIESGEEKNTGLVDVIAFAENAYMNVLPEDIAQLLAKPVPGWAKGSPVTVFYGGGMFVFAKDTVRTLEYALPGSSEGGAPDGRRTFAYFPYSGNVSPLMAGFTRIKLNSDKHRDYVGTIRGSYGSCGSHMHTFLAGIGDGRFVDVGSEYIDDESIRTVMKSYRVLEGVRWYSIVGTQRAGMEAVPARYPFRPKKRNYFGNY